MELQGTVEEALDGGIFSHIAMKPLFHKSHFLALLSPSGSDAYISDGARCVLIDA